MAQIPVFFKGKLVYFAEVDEDMFEEASKHLWRTIGQPNTRMFDYCYRRHNSKVQMLHQYVLGVEKGCGKIVDHIDRDPKNNRKSNLRFVSRRENSWNRTPLQTPKSSKYVGVSSAGNYWKAQCASNSKRCVGYYDTEEKAALAFDYHARRIRGEFAILNFPDKDVLPESRKKPESRFKRKYISFSRRKQGFRYYIQIPIATPRWFKLCDTLEEAIEFRNQKLKELGVPIPD